MRTAFTGIMAEDVYFYLSVQAPFSHRYRFKNTGLEPVWKKKKKNDPHP